MKNLLIKSGLVCILMFNFEASYAQAQYKQFRCENWSNSDGDFTQAGTSFMGQDTQDGYLIINDGKTEINLKFIGNYNTTKVELYAGTNKKYGVLEVFGVSPHSTTHDLEFVKFRYLGQNLMTKCTYY